LELRVVGKSALTPSLIGKPLPDLGGMEIDLAPAQAKGKMILVCFFDMQQRPSRNCLRQLNARAQELKAQEVVVLALQALKIDKSALNQWVKTNNIAFAIGIVQGDEERIRFVWGVRSLPWLILTDGSHIVRTEGFAFSELSGELDKIRANIP
jgi:hypothetical protein